VSFLYDVCSQFSLRLCDPATLLPGRRLLCDFLTK